MILRIFLLTAVAGCFLSSGTSQADDRFRLKSPSFHFDVVVMDLHPKAKLPKEIEREIQNWETVGGRQLRHTLKGAITDVRVRINASGRVTVSLYGDETKILANKGMIEGFVHRTWADRAVSRCNQSLR